MLRRYGTGATCPEGHRAARGRLGMASAGTNFDAGQGTQPAPSRRTRGGGRDNAGGSLPFDPTSGSTVTSWNAGQR